MIKVQPTTAKDTFHCYQLLREENYYSLCGCKFNFFSSQKVTETKDFLAVLQPQYILKQNTRNEILEYKSQFPTGLIALPTKVNTKQKHT